MSAAVYKLAQSLDLLEQVRAELAAPRPAAFVGDCPFCGAVTRVLETRDHVDRRRECTAGHRFWTTESVTRFTKPRS